MEDEHRHRHRHKHRVYVGKLEQEQLIYNGCKQTLYSY